jgi:hypothetical protein
MEFFRVLLSWPFVFLVVLVYFALSRLAPYKLARLLKPFRSLKLFGTEFVLSEEVGIDAEEAIETYRTQVKRKFDSLIETHDIRCKLEAVVNRVQAVIDGHKKITDLRCTLYVPDILFADSLYQLVDYYPVGGRRGRTFSSQFGIIGLCWRMREDQIEGEVSTNPQELIRGWGMTYEQAAASGRGRQSFLALVLRDENYTPVGIFYMDAEGENAFGAKTGDEVFKKELKETAHQESRNSGLTASLVKLRDDLKDRRPAIHIHEK